MKLGTHMPDAERRKPIDIAHKPQVHETCSSQHEACVYLVSCT
jgi:hypothetical protein